jgi:phenylalanyl-tRNA synthetase beta chain
MKFFRILAAYPRQPRAVGRELSHLLTMAGLEVEEEEPGAPQFNDVVVAQVLKSTSIPMPTG